ncbi:hypothetical protein B0T25DRAFT_622449 [Lasiosphaeria hispida]|uniref:Prolyl 4-hydroxylase alpha subunit domain-containing protein n=1 Tax=Lasiosphaeria hispida TaxID=260671 RepID=A0AAJ0HNA4_9PEZI|nr:hypothetical protein B0T25DRAFT_622449 [Lasiosphaeria hispida]
MLSYVIAFVAFLLFFFNPLMQLLNPSAPQIHRTPRPQLRNELLALESANGTNQLDCGPDLYSVHVFSREPLVIYIENFLALNERKHLLEISDPILEPSTVTHDGGESTHRDTTVRDSEVAVIPRTDAVRCIESRARALQGWRDEVWIERLRVQRYTGPGGHYSHHFDWSAGRGGWGRVSSFMVWVDDGEGELEGGGTEFPLLRVREGGRWCDFIECPSGDGDNVVEGGVVFKPVPGNAVYWENFRSDGTGKGHDETWHAGLPVARGVKVGLNIWSWGRIE